MATLNIISEGTVGLMEISFIIVLSQLTVAKFPRSQLCLKVVFYDMTFTHEGNKTCIDGLINFEKMHMLAQTMRTIRYCRSRHLGKMGNLFHYSLAMLMARLYLHYWLESRDRSVLEPPSPKSEGDVRAYISCLRINDNQRMLTSLSQKLEPRRS
uniref:Uncharacterized protein n=1 Tax=Timema cristinae TaxID=61476 RepID=A0A7R9CGQ1_TIMCR|nr:unnamed protein product [Timema cristinae]